MMCKVSQVYVSRIVFSVILLSSQPALAEGQATTANEIAKVESVKEARPAPLEGRPLPKYAFTQAQPSSSSIPEMKQLQGLWQLVGQRECVLRYNENFSILDPLTPFPDRLILNMKIDGSTITKRDVKSYKIPLTLASGGEYIAVVGAIHHSYFKAKVWKPDTVYIPIKLEILDKLMASGAFDVRHKDHSIAQYRFTHGQDALTARRGCKATVASEDDAQLTWLNATIANPPPNNSPVLIDPQLLFSGDDYPARALRNEEVGAVKIQYYIGPEGRANSCKLVESSGSAELDNASCQIMLNRARFIPATDENGKKIAGTFDWAMNWTLP